MFFAFQTYLSLLGGHSFVENIHLQRSVFKILSFANGIDDNLFVIFFLACSSLLASLVVSYLHVRSIIIIIFQNIEKLFLEFFIIPPSLFFSVIISRFIRKNIDVGLGPQPLINNVYHKESLQKVGYTAETFVESVYHITAEFDYRADQCWLSKYSKYQKYLGYYLFVRSVLRYRCIYIYFNGGPLRIYKLYKYVEPMLFQLAKVKIVVLPYGGDVSDMKFCKNLNFKHSLITDYPYYYKQNSSTQKQIKRWTNNANFIVSGCDWVDYNYHWNKLMLAHFSIDINKIQLLRTEKEMINFGPFNKDKPLKIFHAPNHKIIKGTRFIEKAVTDLTREGLSIQLKVVQNKSNYEILKEINESDLVVDQLIIGWYAMFALEALSMGKPVICYLRQDLIKLYQFEGIIESEEDLPFINADIFSIKSTIRDFYFNRQKIDRIANKSIEFVEKYHSTAAIGKVFKEINLAIGIDTKNTSISVG